MWKIASVIRDLALVAQLGPNPLKPQCVFATADSLVATTS